MLYLYLCLNILDLRAAVVVLQGLLAKSSTEEHRVCQGLTQGDASAATIHWLLSMHAETVLAKGDLARSDARFADTACQELRYCPRWEDPEVMRRREVEQRVDAVFS